MESGVNLGAGPQPGVVPGRSGPRRPQTYPYAAFSPTGPFYDAEFAMAWVGGNFWDGRVPDLSTQARQPFVNPDEMNNTPTNGIYPPPAGGYSALVVQKVQSSSYAPLFKQIYGADAFTKYTVPELYTLITEAIAQYEQSGELCQFSSKYDASKYGVPPGTLYTLSASEERGRQLYFGIPGTTNAHCAECHSSSAYPPVLAMTNGKDTFTMYCFANIGVPKNYNNPIYQETDCTSNPHGCNPLGTNFIDTGLAGNPNPAPDGTVFNNPGTHNSPVPGTVPGADGAQRGLAAESDLRQGVLPQRLGQEPPDGCPLLQHPEHHHEAPGEVINFTLLNPDANLVGLQPLLAAAGGRHQHQ